jgi:hypothetical protein
MLGVGFVFLNISLGWNQVFGFETISNRLLTSFELQSSQRSIKTLAYLKYLQTKKREKFNPGNMIILFFI